MRIHALFASKKKIFLSQTVYLIALANRFNRRHSFEYVYQIPKSLCIARSAVFTGSYVFGKDFDYSYLHLLDLKLIYTLILELKWLTDSMWLFRSLAQGKMSDNTSLWWTLLLCENLTNALKFPALRIFKYMIVWLTDLSSWRTTVRKIKFTLSGWCRELPVDELIGVLLIIGLWLKGKGGEGGSVEMCVHCLDIAVRNLVDYETAQNWLF